MLLFKSLTESILDKIFRFPHMMYILKLSIWSRILNVNYRHVMPLSEIILTEIVVFFCKNLMII